ncbi:MAG: alpha/beta fold hydrolase [Deltaproteobacteria bacterium]|nr:alpha/beta fold hydrolase [Deltaproteobacteria bacterium]MBW2390250.1 alpha/beta fold hydrolase [Deltaproteobacteria bacterium]MBW2724755.1 alpha/beta fold hydrolase [Deltaproteobacteria bacterium]
MDCSLSDVEKPLYRVWLHSPSVFGSETETILAYKIANEIHGIPSRVLKALRAQPGVDLELRQRVDEFVENDETLIFVQAGPRRSIALVESSGEPIGPPSGLEEHPLKAMKESELHSIDVDLGNLTIQFDEAGQGGGDFVLLHGLTGHRKDFEFVLPALAVYGRSLAPDLRGHGNSSRTGRAEGYDFETLVDDFCHFLDALGIERCDLLGHSFGGMLALRATLAHPDRVNSLVLMSTSCEAPDLYTRETFVKAGGFAENKGMIKLQARLEEVGRADETPLAVDAPLEQRDWQRRYWSHHKLRLLSMDPYAYGALGLAMMDQIPVTDRLAEIRCPTTIVIGKQDKEFVRGAQLLSAGLAESVCHELPGIGHQPHQEAREAFLEIIAEHFEGVREGASGSVASEVVGST